jgi:hypothetical protein
MDYCFPKFRPGFDPRSCHLRFVLDKVVLGRFSPSASVSSASSHSIKRLIFINHLIIDGIWFWHWRSRWITTVTNFINYFFLCLTRIFKLYRLCLYSVDCKSKSKSKSNLCYDRRPVGQSVLPPSRIWGSRPDFCYCQTFSDSWCGALSLTIRRVYRLQLLLALASPVILGSESRGTRDHISLSQIRDSPNLEGQVPVFISARSRVAQLYPQALGSLFVASYDSQGYGGSMRTRLYLGLSARINMKQINITRVKI